MQEIIHYSTAVEHFSLKRIFTEEGTLDREFLELLNGKLEEGMRVQEFLAEYGKAFRAEDVKRFKGIEKLLSVPQPTISRWLSEGGRFFYSVDHFSLKSVFMEDGKCPQEPVWVCIFRTTSGFSCPEEACLGFLARRKLVQVLLAREDCFPFTRPYPTRKPARPIQLSYLTSSDVR